MFRTSQFTGARLADKHLCLTFDDGPDEIEGDGPGPKTLKIAEFLHGMDISATFFMLGRNIVQHPHIVQQVHDWGHTVGWHTYSHPSLRADFEQGKDILQEFARTQELVSDALGTRRIYFRPPYGHWSPAVKQHLCRNLRTAGNYYGPYHWVNVDTNFHDWYMWRNQASATTCADGYWLEIDRLRRGIILMHDTSADNADDRNNNLTFEMLEILIPRLKDAGYQFVSISEIDE